MDGVADYMDLFGLHVPASDMVLTVLRGIIVGIVAIGVYLLQKHMESKDLRHSVSIMLWLEIDAIMTSVRPAELSEDIMEEKYAIGVYRGLLSSGNIGRLPSDLQKDLSKFYGSHEAEPETMDDDLTVKIITRLERMQADNRKYREKILDLLSLAYSESRLAKFVLRMGQKQS